MKVLKLGGSVITFKDEISTANREQINRLSREIKAAWPIPLVLVHGGGSFGHPVAKKYGIIEGFKSKRQILGFARTHQAMVALNTIFVDSLLSVGVPALSVTPSSFITTKEGRITRIDFENVGRLVVKGILPVLYGDTVLDTEKGFTILSGDQLTVRLGISLGVSKIIFGVDVDGVFTSNPKISPDARLIERLPLEKLDGFVRIGEAITTDVTGGMLGKVSEAKTAVEMGMKVQIVNATQPDVIFKALIGEPVTGTLLTE
ncbi:MAG: isopentenyl phosphate kinase [Candidatus Bathyarchaeota archaeon]|jgi:isopentenyl phosphate kinase